jgi:predicted aspartyl protease
MKRLVALGCAWLSTVAQAQSVPTIPAGLPIPPAGQNFVATTDESARLSVPVAIGGRVWHFLIDTASTRSVIANDVADSLALAPGTALKILNIGGIDTVPSAIIPELGFSNVTVHDVHAPSLERGNLGGDGLLGLDILHNNRISIDFRHAAALTISPSSKRADRATATSGEANLDPDTIVVTARSRMGELIVTDAEIDGIPVSVIIDTGSQESIANPALARMLYRSPACTRVGPATLISVTGRSLPADFALVSKLQIGGITMDNVPMAFADIATFRQFGLVHRPAILLGMQTLRLFARVTIDFPRRNIRFLLRRTGVDRDAI